MNRALFGSSDEYKRHLLLQMMQEDFSTGLVLVDPDGTLAELAAKYGSGPLTQALAAAAAAIDRLTSNASSILMAGHINYGRNIVFDKETDQVYALQRSELLDATTCNYCLSIDGRVFEKDDPQFSSLGPVHSNCRCINRKTLKCRAERHPDSHAHCGRGLSDAVAQISREESRVAHPHRRKSC